LTPRTRSDRLCPSEVGWKQLLSSGRGDGGHDQLHHERRVRSRPSREADRLLLALRAWDDREGEGRRRGVL